MNAAVAMLTTVLPESYDTTRALAMVSFTLFAALLVRRIDNLFFLARTLTLGLIGYYPMMVKVWAGPEALYSHYEFRTQGFEIVVVMYVATSLALLGNEIGLLLGGAGSGRPQPVTPARDETEMWRTIFYVSIPIVIVISYIVATTLPYVLTDPYASGVSKGYLFGNTNNIGITCLLALFVAMRKTQIRFGTVIWAALILLFVVYSMFLRGLRQDVVTVTLGLLVCYGLLSGKGYRLSWKNIAFLASFVVVIEFMGVARSMLSAEFVTMGEMWSLFTSTFFGSSGVYHVGTVSPMGTTFSNMVFLIDSKALEPLLGYSFLEWIPRTPPEFMYPDRPRDYAWIFSDYNLSAGGGFFELAEAYMNFGMAGTLVVPCVISYLMAKSFYYTLRRQTVFSYFLLFSFLGMFMRGTWYQIFAFYKSFWTAIVLLACFYVVHRVRRSMRPRQHSRAELRFQRSTRGAA